MEGGWIRRWKAGDREPEGGDELYQGGSSPLSGRREVRAAAGLDKSTGTGHGDEGELGRQGQKGGIFHVEWTVFSLEMALSGIR